MNKKEFYRKEHYEKKNWLHKNGRVAVGFSRDTWIGACVSPYMKDFKNQVDPGIWPLVEILNKKGYLTCSSCEGHDWMESSFVVVCFGSEESRDKFVKQVLKAKIPQYKIFYQESQTNINLYDPFNDYHEIMDDPTMDETQNWFKIKDKLYFTKTEEEIPEEVIEKETENWNYCFGRKYKRWYYCRLLIGGAVLNGKNPVSIVVHWTRYFWINRLAKFIKENVEQGYD
jgi:hypothetical protein